MSPVGLAVILIAFAYLEEDGLLRAAALVPVEHHRSNDRCDALIITISFAPYHNVPS
jgi:hypothetical protein